MSFRTRRVLLSVPFYMVFQFFLFKYLFLLLGGIPDSYLMAFSVLIGLIRFVPMFFEAKKSTAPGRVLTTIDGVWMWMSLMFFIGVAAIYLIEIFVPLPFEVKLIFILTVPVLGVYNYYKAHKLVVNELTLTLPNLARDINIAHLSDVHFGSVRHREIIDRVANKLKELEGTCEFAVISGDLADGSCVVEEDDFMAFSNVDMPIIFTPGNHDFYPGIDSVIRACENAGVIVLDNERREFGDLSIYGLTFSFDDRGMPELDDTCLNPDMANILNYHVPYYWDEFSGMGFDIQLSGHTHGGQFYPVIWFSNKLFGYNRGLFKNELGKYLHVTTGVGSMDTPMRWGTDSEIVVLKLKSKEGN